MMIREHIRSLRRIVRDLEFEGRKPAELETARSLLAAFLERERVEDDLGAPWRPAKPSKSRVRKPRRRIKPHAAEYALAYLREAGEPKTATEIRAHLAEVYRSIGRAGISYALLQLERAGKIQRAPAPLSSPARHAWTLLEGS